jgi:hypothetical protein
MRIIQTFTKQHTETMFRAILGKMSCKVTNETTSQTEEQIGIMFVQARKGIKGETVYRNINWS